MGTAKLTEVVNFLDQKLALAEFQDVSLNGLQVEAGESVSKVCIAVDAGESLIERAIESNAQMLLVHHGILWNGAQERISGPFGRKIKKLLDGGLNLYAVHLPLDGHTELGNNFLLAKLLGLTELERAVEYKSACIGCLGKNSARLTVEQCAEKLNTLRGSTGDTLILPFGPTIPERVCLVSGSGVDTALHYREIGFDTLITGEPKQMIYHHAKEHGLNVLCAGHYATETVGVEAVGKLLAKQFGIEIEFLDEPTGI